jgi:hypothetical protein
MVQLRKAAKLQACLTAAGTNVSKIEKCEADYSG